MKVVPLLALALLGACGAEEASTSSSLTRPPGACGDIETHVIGEFSGGNGDTTTVTILRPGKHVLVLTAHDPNTWNIVLGPKTELVHVYAVGYGHQTVTGVPAGVDVVTDSMVDTGIWANGYQYPNHDTNSLLTLASKRTHHDATSFHGCHTASQWLINEDMSVVSDCKVGYFQADAITSCGNTGGETCGHSGSGSGGDGQLQ
ncbi:MAG: hypothetical protein JO257_17590 [Deltaproteobacteria bacterium]|nr:hypothetical protein [Deltaproteobacteria bacterium]